MDSSSSSSTTTSNTTTSNTNGTSNTVPETPRRNELKRKLEALTTSNNSSPEPPCSPCHSNNITKTINTIYSNSPSKIFKESSVSPALEMHVDSLYVPIDNNNNDDAAVFPQPNEVPLELCDDVIKKIESQTPKTETLKPKAIFGSAAKSTFSFSATSLPVGNNFLSSLSEYAKDEAHAPLAPLPLAPISFGKPVVIGSSITDNKDSSEKLKEATKTGEEGEETLWSNSQVKLFKFACNEWKDLGTGMLKLNKATSGGSLRFIMRNDVGILLLLNVSITEGMQMEVVYNGKGLKFATTTGTGGGTLVYLTKFKVEAEFRKLIDHLRKEKHCIIKETKALSHTAKVFVPLVSVQNSSAKCVKESDDVSNSESTNTDDSEDPEDSDDNEEDNSGDSSDSNVDTDTDNTEDSALTE